jgi:hypothetical protein
MTHVVPIQVRIPKDLHLVIRVEALRKGKTMSELVVKALEAAYLGRDADNDDALDEDGGHA